MSLKEEAQTAAIAKETTDHTRLQGITTPTHTEQNHNSISQ